MASVAASADQASDMMQKLSLDSQTKSNGGSDAPKMASGAQHGPESRGWQMPSSQRSSTPVMQGFVDPNMCYANGHAAPGYYYGVNEWEEYPRYLSPGIEMSPHGVYGDMYHGYTYAYGAYAPGSGVPTMGHDGQLYSPQHYQYPGTYYQQTAPVYQTIAPSKPHPDVATSTTENPQLPVDKLKANSDVLSNTNAGNGSLPSMPIQKHSTTKGSQNRGSVPGVVPPIFHEQRFGYEGMYPPTHWLDTSATSDLHHRLPASGSVPSNNSHVGSITPSRNMNVQPLPLMGSHPLGPVSGMGLPSPGYGRPHTNNQMYGQYANTVRNKQQYGSRVGDFQMNGRGWSVADGKYNARGRGVGFYGYGNDNMEVLNELNRGPRSGRFKNGQKSPGPNIVLAVKGQSLPAATSNEDSNLNPDNNQYNREDFPDNYKDAKFFVIKSYSEDDIHKSIKYGVWASTPNGNKKLDDAYKEAQGKGDKCPIFLFFSVNTSGQFVGVAEMVGSVDFNKTVEYWQQDKWNGCFPVKWHIVKDVSNSTLKHIILENNESKPVTNSRDTQEVSLDKGNQMIKLFKDHISKSSVLDDFGFYEARQKIMQARRVKQQFQKQVWDGKAVPTLANISISDVANAKQKLHKTWESAPVDGTAS